MHRPGTHVGLDEALRTCRDILEGRHDDIPVKAFYFAGDIEEIEPPRLNRSMGRDGRFGAAYSLFPCPPSNDSFVNPRNPVQAPRARIGYGLDHGSDPPYMRIVLVHREPEVGFNSEEQLGLSRTVSRLPDGTR